MTEQQLLKASIEPRSSLAAERELLAETVEDCTEDLSSLEEDEEDYDALRAEYELEIATASSRLEEVRVQEWVRH